MLSIIFSKKNIKFLSSSFKNFIYLFISRYLSQVITAISNIYLARTLKPEPFGKITFSLAVISYFTVLTNLGLEIVGIREISINRNCVNKYVNIILPLRLTLALLCFIVLVVLAHLIDKFSDVKTIIILYGLYLFPFSIMLNWVFQGLEQMHYNLIAQNMNSILYTLLILLFVKNTTDILKVPLFYFISGMVMSLFLIFKYLTFEDIKPALYVKEWKRLLKLSLPAGLGLLLSNIYYGFDTIILKFFRNMSEVGLYSGAFKIIMFISPISVLVFNSVLPSASNMYISPFKENLKGTLSNLLLLLLFISLFILTFVIIFAKPIINLAYGINYLNSSQSLSILIISIPFQFLTVPYWVFLIASGNYKYWMYSIAIGSSTNLISNIILVPVWGMVGASISYVLTHFFIFIYSFQTVEKKLRFSLLKIKMYQK
jgi:O-antigen/teichoic acid export membrane protein